MSTLPFLTQTALDSEEMIDADASHSEDFKWTTARSEVSNFPFDQRTVFYIPWALVTVGTHLYQ